MERHRNQTDLSPQDLQEITSFWNPKLARRNIKERFELGASLWLIKLEDQLAGYGWTLQGRTVEPHYFRLGPDDVHLFDFHVFPQYRGRGVNPSLVSYILRSLAAESHGRAFIEAAEWNQAQLASLRRTPFRRLGSARKFTLFRHTMVFWGSRRNCATSTRHERQPVPACDQSKDRPRRKHERFLSICRHSLNVLDERINRPYNRTDIGHALSRPTLPRMSPLR